MSVQHLPQRNHAVRITGEDERFAPILENIGNIANNHPKRDVETIEKMQGQSSRTDMRTRQ